jgi:hypothetical protein
LQWSIQYAVILRTTYFGLDRCFIDTKEFRQLGAMSDTNDDSPRSQMSGSTPARRWTIRNTKGRGAWQPGIAGQNDTTKYDE